MNQIELLRHVADNLEAGRDLTHGLLIEGKAIRYHLSVDDFMFDDAYRHSPAPRTRILNGVEVPAPMDKEPKIDEIYWFEHIVREELADGYRWYGDGIDKRLFSIGIYETAEAAAANCKARYGIID